MKKIKAGIIGMGFIGTAHLEALRRLGYVDVAAVCETGSGLVKRKAGELCIEHAYENVDEMLNNPEIEVIHNCTPNNLHFEINKKVIEAGKYLFCEKPLATNIEESGKLVELAEKHKAVCGVNFNYRLYPLVIDIKERIRVGEIGRPFLVHGSYLQDWLLYDTDYNWRLDVKVGGKSRAVADIGSHWCDLVQNVLQSRISEVYADLATIIPVRKKPAKATETFRTGEDCMEYEEIKMDTEDYGAVLLKFDNGVRGVFYVSQVSAGRKCYLNIEVNGSKASLAWNQEDCEKLWLGCRGTPNSIITRDPCLLSQEAREYVTLPGGHGEAWADALKNNIGSFYKYIIDNRSRGMKNFTGDFATIKDGHNIMLIVDAILRSHETGQWVKVEQI